MFFIKYANVDFKGIYLHHQIAFVTNLFFKKDDRAAQGTSDLVDISQNVPDRFNHRRVIGCFYTTYVMVYVKFCSFQVLSGS